MSTNRGPKTSGTMKVPERGGAGVDVAIQRTGQADHKISKPSKTRAKCPQEQDVTDAPRIPEWELFPEHLRTKDSKTILEEAATREGTAASPVEFYEQMRARKGPDAVVLKWVDGLAEEAIWGENVEQKARIRSPEDYPHTIPMIDIRDL